MDETQACTDERAAFEAWTRTLPSPVQDNIHFCMPDESITYKAWQAATVAERERCALIAEGFPRTRDWVPGSLYDTLRREVAARIRRAAAG